MTAELFDRLLYTDCKPGTGRGAGGGFQVQAQSSGVDSAQSKLAVGGLLYDIQLPWLTERRAVQDFPLGFAHVTGEGYGTAQSLYLGKVATGGRDGNHLADCLLTRDPDPYGTVRPAQLWRSALWRAEPWDGKDCPQFDVAQLEPGPLTVDAIADWSRAAPERGPVLARLLSVLEDADGKRVIIVADDAQEAMTWIAAATLLLPSRVALGISFKAFSSTPLDARHRIAAAPAGLFPRIAPGLVSQRFVLDARTCTADEAQTSDRAAFFAGRFAGDADPFDVVDAVELADALGGGRDAILTAWALTKPDDSRPEPAALFRWLSSVEPGLLREHGPATAGMILEASPPVKALRWIDRAVTDERLDLMPAAVRVRLLAAELAEIRDGQAPPREVLSCLPLNAGACRDAQSELSSAILLGSDQQVDLLLCLARRHQIVPELAPALQKRLRDFVNGWIDDSGRYHPDDWALGAEVLDCAHDELRDRVGRHGAASVAGPIRRLARYFAGDVGLAERLDCHIQAALIADRIRQDRIPRLRQLLATIANSTQPSLAATVAAELQHALIEWNAVDGDVAVTVLIDLPDALAVEPLISDRAVRQLTQMSEKPTRGLLELLTSLDKRGKAPSSGPLAGVLKSDRCVREFIRRASDDGQLTDRKYFDETVKLLRQADAVVVLARLDEVLNACLRTRHPDLGPEVLATPRSRLPGVLIERWADTLGTSRDLAGDGFFYVRCLGYKDLPTRRQELLTSQVRAYAQRLDKATSDRWHDAVARRLRPQERDVWESVFVQETSRPRISLWINRDGGRS
jgi:GTPase-associated protein 1, N-terminal domain type 2/GTPase-associated protein 1, middle domain